MRRTGAMPRHLPRLLREKGYRSGDKRFRHRKKRPISNEIRSFFVLQTNITLVPEG